MFTPAMQTGTFTVEVVTSDKSGNCFSNATAQASISIVAVSATAPDVIRGQAIAFQNQVEQVILHYMKRAIQCDRSTVSHLVTEAGQPQLAELIRRP